MRIIATIVLLCLMVSIFPVDTCSADSNFDQDGECTCLLLCSSCHCHNILTPDVLELESLAGQPSHLSCNYSFHYQDPINDQIYRPPISSL